MKAKEILPYLAQVPEADIKVLSVEEYDRLKRIERLAQILINGKDAKLLREALEESFYI